MANDREHNAEPSSNGRAIELWSLVTRHIFLILFMSAAGCGLGYLQFLRTPPVYQSSCSLLVRNDAEGKQIPFQAMENSSASQRVEPHALLILSPVVVERALEMVVGDGSNSRKLRDLPSFEGLETQAAAARIISKLVARPSLQGGMENQNIVNLTYKGVDGLASREVLQAIVTSYQEFLGDSHRNVSTEVLELINQARSSLLRHLSELDADYMQFRQETPLLFSSDAKAINIHKERMKDIELARSKITIALTERRAQLHAIQQAVARGANRDAIVLMLRMVTPENRSAEGKSPAAEIFQLLLEEQLLLMDVGPDHPKVRALQKKIALTQEFFLSESSSDAIKSGKPSRGDFLNTCIDSIRHEINGLESTIMELDEQYHLERHESKSVAVYESKNETFEKDYQRTELLYQGVVKRLEELNLLKDYGGFKTAIISPPRFGVQVAPVFSQCLLIGALCGAAIGFALGYLAEANDKTFRSPEEVSEYLGLPIVGHTPIFHRDAAPIQTETGLDPMLVTYHRPKSRMSESYRAIRTSLYFSTRGEHHKIIQISSPNPGDGKTTLSTNLCISIAQSGKRVLLIDADFRRPRIHELLSLDKTTGISSVISGDVELPDAIQPTEIENLWALPCGPRPNNPCELLTSRRFDELLEVLRNQYDFVIIDTPPLLAVTDPSAVSARVDGVIITLRLTKRTRIEAAKATELVQTVGGNILGIVINGVSPNKGYGYGYRYDYGKYGGYAAYDYQYAKVYGQGDENENPYYTDDEEQAPKHRRSSS